MQTPSRQLFSRAFFGDDAKNSDDFGTQTNAGDVIVAFAGSPPAGLLSLCSLHSQAATITRRSACFVIRFHSYGEAQPRHVPGLR